MVSAAGICCWWNCGRPSSRPYIGGSQHNSILELALGYNGFGRLTGNEPGGLGNLNHDVGWGRLLGCEMGARHRLAAARRADLPRGRTGPHPPGAAHRPARAALVIWGGWLVVTAAVFSYMNGIVHPYYTVALAPAIAAVIGIGATLLWQQALRRPRRDSAGRHRRSSRSSWRPCCCPRHGDWMPWLRAAVAVGGVGAAGLLLIVGRLAEPAAATSSPVSRWSSCLAAPAAYSLATAATPHSGAIPSVGPARGGGPGGASRAGGLLEFTDAPARR